MGIPDILMLTYQQQGRTRPVLNADLELQGGPDQGHWQIPPLASFSEPSTAQTTNCYLKFYEVCDATEVLVDGWDAHLRNTDAAAAAAQNCVCWSLWRQQLSKLCMKLTS